tara:strand:+ start:12299 stop:13927 length:1629 start_codon:yes stop_codon:yes gene_type:complete
MSENVGSIVYEVDANTSGLVAAQGKVDAANKSMQKGFAKTDASVNGINKTFSTTDKSAAVLQKNFSETTVKTNKLGHSMRMASMQLSQVAQQGSVTGNYLQALAIQLPDLALGFGTVGIIAGALAGSLAMPLYNAIVGVDEKTKEYNATIKDTIASLQSVRLEETAGAIDTLTDNIAKNASELEKNEAIREKMRGKSSRGGTNERRRKQLAEEDALIIADQKKNNEALEVLQKRRADIQGEGTLTSTGDAEGDRLAEIFANRQAASIATIEQIKQQFQDEQTLAEEQLEMRLTAIDDAQISVAEKEQAEYEAKALHAQKLSELDAKRTTDEQAEAAKRLSLKKMELAAYTQLGGQLTNLVAAAGAENTAIGKAVFLANQALAVAGIIVNTQAAAAQALSVGGPIAGPALAANITALGYTSAAIAGGVGIGQTFSGRQTGGPTEAGTPYRVGESGPELFTSGGRQFLIGGEKGNVMPNSQLGGGMSAPQVNVVVNNNTASNVSVSQEQDGNNVTIQMLVADFAEGGPVSRAMSNSHSVKRKTT